MNKRQQENLDAATTNIQLGNNATEIEGVDPHGWIASLESREKYHHSVFRLPEELDQLLTSLRDELVSPESRTEEKLIFETIQLPDGTFRVPKDDSPDSLRHFEMCKVLPLVTDCLKSVRLLSPVIMSAIAVGYLGKSSDSEELAAFFRKHTQRMLNQHRFIESPTIPHEKRRQRADVLAKEAKQLEYQNLSVHQRNRKLATHLHKTLGETFEKGIPSDRTVRRIIDDAVEFGFLPKTFLKNRGPKSGRK